jgi:hypothetical protein
MSTVTAGVQTATIRATESEISILRTFVEIPHFDNHTLLQCFCGDCECGTHSDLGGIRFRCCTVELSTSRSVVSIYPHDMAAKGEVRKIVNRRVGLSCNKGDAPT